MFMAPEVYRSQNYNEKADVFSFACIMYEVFARFIVSTSVVGPTGDPDTARVYAHKVRTQPPMSPDCAVWPQRSGAADAQASVWLVGMRQPSDCSAAALRSFVCCRFGCRCVSHMFIIRS